MLPYICIAALKHNILSSKKTIPFEISLDNKGHLSNKRTVTSKHDISVMNAAWILGKCILEEVKSYWWMNFVEQADTKDAAFCEKGALVLNP